MKKENIFKRIIQWLKTIQKTTITITIKWREKDIK